MEERTSVVRVAVVSFIGLVVALVIVGIIIWAIFFRGGDNGQTPNAPGSSSTPSGGSSQPAPNNPSASPSTSGNGSNTSGSNTTSSGNNSSTSGKSGGQSNLTNTGPGTTIAVFVASSLLGTVIYQYAIRRRSHARN
jgi:hypothetical protein